MIYDNDGPKTLNKFFYFVQTLYDILAGKLTYFTFDNSGSAVRTSSKV